MFKIENRMSNKTLLLTAEGFITEDEARKLIEDFKAKVSTINPREYKLIIDARNQKASSPAVVPLQQEALKLYMDTPFKSRKSVVLGSVITMAQIKRLGQNELLTKFDFVDTLEEAFKG